MPSLRKLPSYKFTNKTIVIAWFPPITGLKGEPRLLNEILNSLLSLGIDLNKIKLISIDDPKSFESNKNYKLIDELYLLNKITFYPIRNSHTSLKDKIFNYILLSKKLAFHIRNKDFLIARIPHETFSFLLTLFEIFYKHKIYYYMGLFGSHTLSWRVISYYRDVSEPNRIFSNIMIKRSIIYLPLNSLTWIIRSIIRPIIMTNIHIIYSIHKKTSIYVYPVIDHNFWYYKRLVDPHDKSLLVVSRIHPYKNIDKLIILIYHLNKLIKDLNVTIVGRIEDEKYFNYINNLIKNKKINHIIKIETKLTDPKHIRNAYWKHNMLINLSAGALGLVNAEASACGTVPIAHREFRDGCTPYCIEYTTYREALRSIVNLINDPDNIKYRGYMGSQYARKYFTLDEFKKKLMMLFSLYDF